MYNADRLLPLGRTDTLCLILVQIGSICVDLDLQFYRGKIFCYSFCIVKYYMECEIQTEKGNVVLQFHLHSEHRCFGTLAKTHDGDMFIIVVVH